MEYNQATQRAIARHDITVCNNCNDIIQKGVSIHDEVYCNGCIRDILEDLSDEQILDIKEWNNYPDTDIDIVIASMCIADICRCLGWTVWGA